MIGRQPNLARLRDHGLCHLHFAVVEVAQRTIGLNARDAYYGDVYLELAHEIHRCFADDAAVARAHHAAGHDDLAFRVAAQDGGHVEVVGDHAQTLVVQQRARNRLGGGADVEDQRAVVWNLARHVARNAGLLGRVQRLALRVRDVFHRGSGDTHPTMKTREQAFVGQTLYVAPHGLQGDAQGLGELLHRSGLARVHFFEQEELSRVGIHTTTLNRTKRNRLGVNTGSIRIKRNKNERMRKILMTLRKRTAAVSGVLGQAWN